MKPKLTKTIMSSLAFTCALGCPVVAMTLGTSVTARATAKFPQPCSVQTLNGLYVWTFDGYENFGGDLVPKAIMQAPPVQRRWYDVQSIRHCEYRGHDHHRCHRRGRNIYGRAGLHGHA